MATLREPQLMATTSASIPHRPYPPSSSPTAPGRPSPTPSPTPPPTSATPAGVPAGTSDSVAALPSGIRALAYVVKGNLWVRTAAAPLPRRLTDDGRVSRPRLSATGKWVAYCRDGVLFANSTAGFAEQTFGQCSGAAWSPVADVLAFLTPAGQVLLGEVGDGWRIRSLPGHDVVGDIVWKPDGRAVAFVEESLIGGLDSSNCPLRAVVLKRTSIDGTSTTELVAVPRPSGYGLIAAAWTRDAVLYFIVPVFSSSLTADGTQLMAVPAGGGTPRLVVDDMLTHADYLSVSPDGRRLAAVEGGGRYTWTYDKQLTVVNPSTGTRRRLTSTGDIALSPTWSPDGLWLAFGKQPDVGDDGDSEFHWSLTGQRRIWRIRPDGSGLRQLTHDTAYRDESPHWSSDSRNILFVRVDKAMQSGSLWAVAVAGGEPIRLAGCLGAAGDAGEGWGWGYYGHIDWSDVFDLR